MSGIYSPLTPPQDREIRMRGEVRFSDDEDRIVATAFEENVRWDASRGMWLLASTGSPLQACDDDEVFVKDWQELELNPVVLFEAKGDIDLIEKMVTRRADYLKIYRERTIYPGIFKASDVIGFLAYYQFKIEQGIESRRAV